MSSRVMRHLNDHVADLLLLSPVVVAVFCLKLFLALQDPVLHAVDPWLWTTIVQTYSKSDLRYVLSTAPVYPGADLYPKGFAWLATLITILTGASAYEVLRFYPVISSLNLIPMYFFSLGVSKSRRVAVISVVLISMSKSYMIRTSIANAEVFTHFWLVFSLFFLLRLDYEPSWRNTILSVFFITMTLMFWHFPIVIYVIFLTLLAIWHFRNGRYIRKLIAVVLLSISAAGLLWYFWADPVPFAQQIATYVAAPRVFSVPGILLVFGLMCLVGIGLLSSRKNRPVRLTNVLRLFALILISAIVGAIVYYLAKLAASYTLLSVEQWGYLLPVLAVCGLACILASRNWRRDPSKVFLILYLTSILALVAGFLIALQGPASIVLTYYVFSPLALPLSILGAVAVVGAVDVLTSLYMNNSDMGKLATSRLSPFEGRRRVRALSLIVVVITLVFVSSNAVNYGGQCSGAQVNCTFVWPGPYEAIRTYSTVKLPNSESITVVNVIAFQYAKWVSAPSADLYNALKWISVHSNQRSHVVAFLGHNWRESQGAGGVMWLAFPAISERSLINGTQFVSSLMQSPTDFKESVIRASGGDAYVVIGILSWLGEEWGNSTLEARFLSYAAQWPDLFPEVHREGLVNVFHVTAVSAVPASGSTTVGVSLSKSPRSSTSCPNYLACHVFILVQSSRHKEVLTWRLTFHSWQGGSPDIAAYDTATIQVS